MLGGITPQDRNRARAGWAGLAVGLALLAGAVAADDRVRAPQGPGIPVAASPTLASPAPIEALTPSPVGPAPASDPTPPPAPPPEPAVFEAEALPLPDLVGLLPPGLPQASVTDLAQLPRAAAAPTQPTVPVWADPDESAPPVLALPDAQYESAARWVVLAERPGWVQVLVPQGRRALPSQDPAGVNRAAGWVRAADVTVTPETSAAVVDLSDRTVQVTHADGRTETVAAAVGAPGTPTPLGLTQVLTVAQSQVGPAVYTSAQSEAIDSFLGSGGAVVALHVGPGQGGEVSNGCVRLTPGGFAAVRTLPVGAPILVVP